VPKAFISGSVAQKVREFTTSPADTPPAVFEEPALNFLEDDDDDILKLEEEYI